MGIQYHLESQSMALSDGYWQLVKTFDTRRKAELAKARLTCFGTIHRIIETLPLEGSI